MALVDTKLMAKMLEDQIEVQRTRLEQPLEEIVTARLRGRIAGCRYVLDELAKMDAPKEDEP